MTQRKTTVYYAQNRAIHKARQQLGMSLDDARALAGTLNLGIESLSRLTLTQRHALLARLIALGAEVRNPQLTPYDLADEARATGRKVLPFSTPSRKQLQMLDALAAQVQWRTPDGYLRFCYKQTKAPSPRNQRQVTRMRLTLENMIAQQCALVGATPCGRPGGGQARGPAPNIPPPI